MGPAIPRRRSRGGRCDARQGACAHLRSRDHLPRAAARYLQVPVQRHPLRAGDARTAAMREEAGSLSALAGHIARAARMTVLTGAGVSAASGIPTFRGVGGLWRQYRAEDLATPDAFRRDPRLVWEWYESRRAIVAGAQPNDAHRVLADWSRRRRC